jgi:hypothetical protein
MDGDLSGARLHAVSAHLETCSECARHLAELRSSSAMLSDLARLSCPEPLAAGVLDRLEVESRGPGLALLFRSAWAARPLMFPSLLPAAMVLVCTLGLIFMVGGRDIRAYHETSQGHADAFEMSYASGTDLDPFMPVAGVSLPHPAGGGIFVEETLALRPLETEPIFMETTVTRDGRVRNPVLLQGDSHLARSLLQAMRMQQFVPAQDDGRPVAVRTYRLYESVEVRGGPLT